MNLEKLINALPENQDGAFICSTENRLYFTGFASSAGYLLATKRGSVFLTDSRYIEAARNKIKSCDVVELKSMKEQLPGICAQLGCRSLYVEAQRMTLHAFRNLEEILNGIGMNADNTLDNIICSIRSIKSGFEIKRIKTAQAIAERAFEHILKFIIPGVSEREIALELDYFMLREGAHGLSFETIAVSGENSSMPHGTASQRKIKNGDFITMDFGAVFDGYHSDMTRTVAVGDVSRKHREVYNTVLNAQKAALEAIKEGVACAAADAAARDIITAAGYGEYFRHSTGHGVGVEIHEEPSLSPTRQEVLRAGNIVTVEPGIYLPGEFGVRIEDMVAVTKDGCENLTSCPKELIIV
jgi:Xaa-Pro aminopeptidase